MKPPLFLVIIASVAFIAIMWLWKQTATMLVTEYGSWIGFTLAAIIIVTGFLWERRSLRRGRD